MEKEEFSLLDDTLLTLENCGQFHAWFMDRKTQCIPSEVLRKRMIWAYPPSSRLTAVDRMFLYAYFSWAWHRDRKGEPPRPRDYFPPPLDASLYTVKVDKAGRISGLGCFEEREQLMTVGIGHSITGLKANGVVIDDLCNTDFATIEERIAAHLLKEIPMSKLTFKQQFLLNGTDVSTLSDEQIYSAIRLEEARIEGLEKIQTKPKRLQAEIEGAKANLAKLVEHLDAK